MRKPPGESSGPGSGRLVLAHLGACATVVVALAVLGVVAGLIWHLVAPRTEYVIQDGARLFAEPVPGAPVAAEGWFAVIVLVAGVLTGSLTQTVFRRRMLGAVIGLGLGAMLASLVAWQVGHWFGAAEYAAALDSARGGTRLLAPLDLHAKGVLTLWPLAASLTVFLGGLIEEGQRVFARARSIRAPAPPPDLPPIVQDGEHTSTYPYSGPAGGQGSPAS